MDTALVSSILFLKCTFLLLIIKIGVNKVVLICKYERIPLVSSICLLSLGIYLL